VLLLPLARASQASAAALAAYPWLPVLRSAVGQQQQQAGASTAEAAAAAGAPPTEAASDSSGASGEPNNNVGAQPGVHQPGGGDQQRSQLAQRRKARRKPGAAAAAAAAAAAGDGAAGAQLPPSLHMDDEAQHLHRLFSQAADEQLCVICLDQPKRVGVLHNGSLHLCLCSACAEEVGLAGGCPVCRQPIEELLPVF
jgi:hypothetical protein